jgi:hypothetical protein
MPLHRPDNFQFASLVQQMATASSANGLDPLKPLPWPTQVEASQREAGIATIYAELLDANPRLYEHVSQTRWMSLMIAAQLMFYAGLCSRRIQ